MENTNEQELALATPSERALTIFKTSETEKKLEELKKRGESITSVKTKDEREEAHRAGMDLRQARTSITKTGKEARDDANAFCKAVLEEEKRLIAIIQPTENAVLDLRDEFDKAEREKEEAEQNRKNEILGRIEEIKKIPESMQGLSSQEIKKEFEALLAFECTESIFSEFVGEAIDAVSSAISELRSLFYAQSEKEEAEEKERKEKEEKERVHLEAVAELARQQEEVRKLQEELRQQIENAKRLQAEALKKIGLEESDEDEEEISVSDAFELFTGVTDELMGGTSKNNDSVKDNTEYVDFTESELFTEAEIEDEKFDGASESARFFAIHTAEQFELFSKKVELFGFVEFSNELLKVSHAVFSGDYDTNIDQVLTNPEKCKELTEIEEKISSISIETHELASTIKHQ